MNEAEDSTTKSLTNTEIRKLYLERVSQIEELNEKWIKQGLSAKERAEVAWHIRHEARIETRALMSDPSDVAALRARDIALYGNPDGPTFEFLIREAEENGLSGDMVFEAIIKGSYKTNIGVNKKLGF